MPKQVEAHGADGAAEGKLPAVERRRPGRVNYANRWLIALLRGSPQPREPEADVAIQQLAPAKGIMLGSAISVILWGAIALIVRQLILG